MKAVVHTSYGPPDVLRVEEVDAPVPGDSDVLVRVHASTVNRSDCGYRRPHPWFVRFFTGLRRPRRQIPGTDFAGQVEQTGAAVTEFAPGDRVFGLSPDDFGAHAELLRLPESGPIERMPNALSFQEGAAVPDGAVLALGALRAVGLQSGQRILIYGASGSIGTATVQLAKHMGADVTAVCNTENVDVVRSLGADRVIDYTKDDFIRAGETYDLIFDAVGKTSFRRCRPSLERGGDYVASDLGFMYQVPWLALVTRFVGSRRVRLPLPRYTKENLSYIADLVEAGDYRPVIDRTYVLEDVVDATAYVETEQKTGNVVLTIGVATET